MTITESALLNFVALQNTPERASVDPNYATQVLKCPGLLVPTDLIGILLLSHFKQKAPKTKISTIDYHVYGQLYTNQSVRFCGAIIDEDQVLLWAESTGFLLYRALVKTIQ